AAATLVLGAATLLALLVASGPAELGIATGNLAAMALQLVLLGVCLGGLALAVGATTGSRGPAFAVTAGVAVLGYFAHQLAAQQDATAWLQRLSPFFYYGGGQPLGTGGSSVTPLSCSAPPWASSRSGRSRSAVETSRCSRPPVTARARVPESRLTP